MTLEEVLGYLGLWSAIGCALFSAYVVVVFRAGMVFTARKEDGTLKEQIPLIGYLNMLFLLFGIVGFQVVANYFGVASKGYGVSFFSLILLNFGHYVILFLFDTIVVDGLVLSVWRPGFLRLPEAMSGESMMRHMLLSIPVGIMAGMVLSVLSAVVSYLAVFKG
jgi:hypothetical protein